MNLEECIKFIDENPDLTFTSKKNNGEQVEVTASQLKGILANLDNLDELTRSINIELIETIVGESMARQKEIQLIGMTPELQSVLQAWLMHLESKISEVKPIAQNADDSDPIKNDLIHLYFYRKHLKEILKYV